MLSIAKVWIPLSSPSISCSQINSRRKPDSSATIPIQFASIHINKTQSPQITHFPSLNRSKTTSNQYRNNYCPPSEPILKQFAVLVTTTFPQSARIRPNSPHFIAKMAHPFQIPTKPTEISISTRQSTQLSITFSPSTCHQNQFNPCTQFRASIIQTNAILDNKLRYAVFFSRLSNYNALLPHKITIWLPKRNQILFIDTKMDFDPSTHNSPLSQQFSCQSMSAAVNNTHPSAANRHVINFLFKQQATAISNNKIAPLHTLNAQSDATEIFLPTAAQTRRKLMRENDKNLKIPCTLPFVQHFQQ